MPLKVIKFDPPLADALVAFVDPNTRRVVAGGLTDSQGRLSVYIREGTYELYVSKSGYNPYRKTVQITKDTVISVNLADPDVVDPIYLYNKAGEVINPATEDTLQTILSHAQWIGGHRLKHHEKRLWNYSLAAGEEYVWLEVSGVGCVTTEGAYKPDDGVDMFKVAWYIHIDGKVVPFMMCNPFYIKYWRLGSVGVHSLGSMCLIINRFDTSTGWFEAQLLYNPQCTRFRETLSATVKNGAASDTTVHHDIHYLLFTASTTIQLIADEKVNANDLKKYINLEYARQLVSSVTYHALPLTSRHLEAAKAVLEGKTPPEPYTGLSREEAQLWLQLGEGKHHLVELTVDEKKFANLKEFWEFIEWLCKEFNMKLLDIGMEALNIPDYIP